MVWIAAPAGYGKTTLVASYLKTRKLPTFWYQLDEGDADIATYFYYLGLAAKQAAPRVRWSLPAFTPEYFAGLPVFARRYFEQMATHLPAGTVCVLDNYQDVPPEALLHEVIHNGLSQIPAGMNLIIVSRHAPPPAYVADRANDVIAVIDQEALRLTVDESLGIYRTRRPRAVDKMLAQTARQLHERVHGWAAGLVLMAERGRDQPDIPAAPKNVSQEEVFDYFYRELFQKADQETQQLLLRTAFLPIVSPAAAEQLTHNRHAGEILARLHRNNFFTLRHTEPTTVYQYHPLLREFLGAQAQRLLETQERMELIRRSANVLEQEGRIEDAAQLLQAVGDAEPLAALIKHHAPAFLERGRHLTVLAWLEKLPPALREGDPWLTYWLGACRFPFDTTQARELFTQAYAEFRARADAAGIFLSWASAVEAIVFEWDDFSQLGRWIADLDELTRLFPLFPSAQIEARVVSCMFVAIMYQQPYNAHMEHWCQRLETIVRQTRDPNARVHLGAHLFIYHLVWRGELTTAEGTLGLIRPPNDAKLSAITEVLWQVCVANWCWMTDRPEEGLAAVVAAQRVVDEQGVTLWSFIVNAGGADIALSRGDAQTAGPFIARLDMLVTPRRRVEFAHHLVFRAWTARLRGDLSDAVAATEECLTIGLEIQGTQYLGTAEFGYAQALQQAGESQRAIVHATRALEVGKRVRSSVVQYCALWCLAWACLESGREIEGLEHLRAAFALGREKNYARVIYYFNNPDVFAKLCARAIEAGIEVDYARAMIRERGLLPPAAEPVSESWPFPLKLYALGRFAIVNDDKPVTVSGKAQKKPLELLKALLALGGRGVAAATLAQTLWPDTDADIAQRTLDTTLHRLRRLLGEDRALTLHDGQLSLNPGYCWVDVWAFERLLSPTNDAAVVGAQTEKALALYQGPFLGRDDAYWALALRERVRSKFLRAVVRRGQSLEATTQWAASAECYLKGIEVDHLAEEFYRRLMHSYHQLNRRAEAMAVYERCCRALSSVLGIEPAQETKALYKEIQGAMS